MSIEWDIFLNPINRFENNEWAFNEDVENKMLIEEISLSAYALFKFLLYTNLIYSVEEIEINGDFLTEIIKAKLYYQLDKWRNMYHTTLSPIKIIHHNNLSNQQLNKNKDDVACNCTDHPTKWILTNSFRNYDPIFKQRSIDIDNQKYTSEVESLLEYFCGIKHTSINRKLVSKIFSNFSF